jgi:Putative zinc-finger
MSGDMNDDQNGTDPFIESDAAYVMGALTEADRHAFEAHLLGCPRCSQSVAELSGMTGLLDKVPLSRVLAPDTQSGPPPDLMLSRLIRAARAQRRRRAVWLAASGAVAASVVALAIVIGVTQTGSTRPPGVTVAMSTVKPGAAVAATLQVAPTSWGTRVSLDCRWVGAATATDPGVRKVYRLVALPRDGGKPQTLAQWAVLPGQDAKVVGSTDLAAGRIASIELRAVADDSVLLRAQPRA